ncbi:DUF1508 domain-containing protein [Sphingomonas sp. RP10(2022)]|uniref:DUF1508 domain-containing protein n=1 Tax=Sphingomonas liriopis TaxID=2949094 RepID=A0A9X2HPL2_9SPHN|nr:DUF1508 domain-containing protein [Sphingomonas liriopis]MCP3734057.1 DUF1508 domain-containing protein [Sphingomonas liriopis]
MYYEIYPQAGQWRWRLKGGNHETLASGESYTTKASCEHVIALLKSTTVATPVKEV